MHAMRPVSYSQHKTHIKAVLQIAALLHAAHTDPLGVMARATGLPRAHVLHVVQTRLMLHALRRSYGTYSHRAQPTIPTHQ